MTDKEKTELALACDRRIREAQAGLVNIAKELRAMGKPDRGLESMFKAKVRREILSYRMDAGK